MYQYPFAAVFNAQAVRGKLPREEFTCFISNPNAIAYLRTSLTQRRMLPVPIKFAVVEKLYWRAIALGTVRIFHFNMDYV